MTADDPSTTGTDAPDTDGARIAATLERLGERDQDIAPEVFVRFIERRPEFASLFRTMVPEHPPLGCGNMVFEILCVLKDNADGLPYVDAYLRELVAGHGHFGVERAADYADLLDTVIDVIASRLGADWPDAERTAWVRQTTALQARIRCNATLTK